jgi:hypothetical protein
MVLKAMAMRAQRVDCHDNCEGEPGLEMGETVPPLGIGQGKIQEGVSLITDEILKCCEVCACVRLGRTALQRQASYHVIFEPFSPEI